MPEVVASMQKLAVDKAEDEEISGPCQRRSLRKRKPRNLDLINLNRRSVLHDIFSFCILTLLWNVGPGPIW